MFENMNVDDSIQEEGDSLGGFGPLDSGLYTFDIDACYVTKSKGGATGINLQLSNDKKETLKHTLWAASGDAKGNKNYYMMKDEKRYLPGFIIANAIALLAAGKNIAELSTDKATLKLYNPDPEIKKEVPTEVDMITALVGKQITLGVLRQTVDKTSLNDSTGAYEPTGETRDENEVVKVFRASTGLTVAEIKAGIKVPEFKDKWADKWAGITKMKAKGTGAVAGGPAAAQATGAAAKTEALFGDA